MTEHLSEAQIERYVTRRATVDELLDAAQHLDACDECRDRAAALAEPGSGEIRRTGRRRASGPHAPVSGAYVGETLLPFVAAALLLALIAVVLWLVIA